MRRHQLHITNLSPPRWQCYHTKYDPQPFQVPGFWRIRLANDCHHDISNGLVEITEEIAGHDMIDLEP